MSGRIIIIMKCIFKAHFRGCHKCAMVDIQSAATEIRRGIKEEDRKKSQGKNIMSASATQGGHNNIYQDMVL